MPRSKPVEEEKDQESAPELPALAISPEKVCFVIVKAREFDVKDAVTEPDTGSNASDDNMISVLEDHGDDPVLEELTAFISSLSEDEQVDLVALAWLGRDDKPSRIGRACARRRRARTAPAPPTRPTTSSACPCSAITWRRGCPCSVSRAGSTSSIACEGRETRLPLRSSAEHAKCHA
jgi:hypothetical protein